MASDGARDVPAGQGAAGATGPQATGPQPATLETAGPESPGLETAFARFRDMLASDGYTLSWSVTGQDRVVVRIEAGPEACADCLVPLPVMEAIMSDALAPTGYALDHIVLPTQPDS
jgi:hypothetical protein